MGDYRCLLLEPVASIAKVQCMADIEKMALAHVRGKQWHINSYKHGWVESSVHKKMKNNHERLRFTRKTRS